MSTSIEFTPCILLLRSLIPIFEKTFVLYVAEPGDKSTEGRCSSLEFAKKAISFFMPDKHEKWNRRLMSGNPTMSPEVNDVLKEVKRLEVRRMGKPSQARAAFTVKEYSNIMEAIEAINDVAVRLFLSAIFRYQYNMGARIDDSSKKLWKNLKRTMAEEHSLYYVISKLCWSKNIYEEREAPDQILLAASNNYFCVIVGLASWLEYMIGRGWLEHTEFLFALDGYNDPKDIKQRASDSLKAILGKDNTFDKVIKAIPSLDDQKLGTHSMRKFVTTFAICNGVPIDMIDVW